MWPRRRHRRLPAQTNLAMARPRTASRRHRQAWAFLRPYQSQRYPQGIRLRVFGQPCVAHESGAKRRDVVDRSTVQRHRWRRVRGPQRLFAPGVVPPPGVGPEPPPEPVEADKRIMPRSTYHFLVARVAGLGP